MSQILQFISNSGPAGFIQTLTGNTGGAVGPTVGNINVVGTGSVAVTGNPGTSTLTISDNGLLVYAYTATSASPYVATATDTYISVDSSGGAKVVQLPNAPVVGRVFIVKDRTGSAGANTITVTTVGGVVNIDGATTFVMNTNYESSEFLFNGTAYEVF